MDTINKIIRLLSESGRTQKELTDSLGIEKSVFSAWKNGSSKSYNKYISQISDFFNVTTDYLLNADEGDREDNENNSDKVKVLFRHLQEVPDADREQLIDTLESTIDIYLKAKGLK